MAEESGEAIMTEKMKLDLDFPEAVEIVIEGELGDRAISEWAKARHGTNESRANLPILFLVDRENQAGVSVILGGDDDVVSQVRNIMCCLERAMEPLGVVYFQLDAGGRIEGLHSVVCTYTSSYPGADKLMDQLVEEWSEIMEAEYELKQAN
jgi:hypothetical protein